MSAQLEAAVVTLCRLMPGRLMDGRVMWGVMWGLMWDLMWDLM
jgi:hypothetical protein